MALKQYDLHGPTCLDFFKFDHTELTKFVKMAPRKSIEPRIPQPDSAEYLYDKENVDWSSEPDMNQETKAPWVCNNYRAPLNILQNTCTTR